MRGEPVEPLATIEEELQRPNAEPERRETEPIEPSSQRSVGAPSEEQQDAESAQHAERHVDAEHPALAIGLREPAADARAEDRSEHHAKPEHRHGLALLLGRIGVEQYGLRQRHERRAKDALEQAEGHDLRKRYGRAAEHRSHDETADRRQE